MVSYASCASAGGLRMQNTRELFESKNGVGWLGWSG